MISDAALETGFETAEKSTPSSFAELAGIVIVETTIDRVSPITPTVLMRTCYILRSRTVD